MQQPVSIQSKQKVYVSSTLIYAHQADEYRKSIEKDPALARRFQPVQIEEPTVESTIAILRGLKSKYELHHGVEISDAALVSGERATSHQVTLYSMPLCSSGCLWRSLYLGPVPTR